MVPTTESRGGPRPSGGKPGPLILRALALGAYGAALVAGVYAPGRAFRPEAVVLLSGFIVYFLWRIHALVTRPQSSDLDRVEVGLLAVLALSTALEVTGPPLHWHTAAYGVLLVGLAASVPFPSILVLPLATVTLWQPTHAWLGRVFHLEILTATAGMVAILEVKRRKKLQTALKKLDLDTEHLGTRAEGSAATARVDLARLDDVVYDYLEEVKRNAGAHGALLCVKTPRGELFVRELVSDSHHIRDEAVLNLDGTILQWILKNRKPLRIGRLKNPSARLGYYTGTVPVESFLGVPLTEGAEVEGVLAVDSLRENAFSDTHQNMLRMASHQIVTILAQIQALEGVKREARDFQHLHEFSSRLGDCRSVADLLALILATVRERVQVDLSAVALLAPEGQLSLEAVGEAEWMILKGCAFDLDAGLAGWVLASGQYLHYKEGRRVPRRPLLSQALRTPEFQSLLIHPLEVRENKLGVLCLACRAPGAFDQPAVAFCEVIAQQGAHGILQIRALEQLQALASTDGLTGLANRRVFVERLTEEVSRCHRYGQPLALLLLDLDHFKVINDRHGHSAGDKVLRATARSLEELARETDLVCRYGGEEFAVLAPSTDEEGALAVAERFRAGVELLATEWEGKPIPARVSVGVATLEGEDDTVEGLVGRADRALYAAKEGGRNRVVTSSGAAESPSPP